ncbi:MAG: alpha-amylase family glycosyl hydrolase [Gaiellaceae bacterium MAG52_C11]|nr:alpha-amylase family glycosyl hydrolase [Candidatus Gaiellasilicea maunaloa]
MSRSVRALLALAGLALVVGSAGASPDAPPPAPSGATLALLAQPPTRTSIASQRIYFVMPDRYANGEPANDRGRLTGGRTTTGFDPADPGWYHGGDLEGLTGDCADTSRGLARIKALGFTALWLTPPFGQKPVQGDSAAYHGYWIRDFTSVDPHLGTEQDFAVLVECAHRLGLKVYLDVVVNHTADVITPTGSAYSGAPYRDCRGRPFDPARHSAGKTFPCLRIASMPRVPVLLGSDRAAKKPAWLNDPLRYHNRGDIAFDSCSETCLEQGDFFGLDDLFTEQPRVVNGLVEVYASWIARYKIDGFRIDTAKHVNAAFFKVWVPKIRAAARTAGVHDFEIFGEVFQTDAIDLSRYVRRRGLPNVLDFPFQDAAVRFAGGSAGARALSSRLGDDDYFRTPSGIAPTPPTFLGNHDIGRAAQQIALQSRATGAQLLGRVQLGNDLMYLFRGAPVVLYGDEVGIVGRGGDKAARQDLFPTRVAQWRTETRVGSAPIGGGSSFDVKSPIATRLQTLAALRQAHPALSTGASIVRRAVRGVFVVSRIDADARHEYVAAFNSGTSTARVAITTATPASHWTPLLGTAAATSDGAGRATVTLPPLSSLLLRADAELAAPKPAAPLVSVTADDLTDLVRLTVAGGSQPISVAFAVRRAKRTWRRLAVDDSPPYRAFVDPTAYRRGETVHVVAVARGLDGSTAVSRVIPVTPQR